MLDVFPGTTWFCGDLNLHWIKDLYRRGVLTKEKKLSIMLTQLILNGVVHHFGNSQVIPDNLHVWRSGSARPLLDCEKFVFRLGELGGKSLIIAQDPVIFELNNLWPKMMDYTVDLQEFQTMWDWSPAKKAKHYTVPFCCKDTDLVRLPVISAITKRQQHHYPRGETTKSSDRLTIDEIKYPNGMKEKIENGYYWFQKNMTINCASSGEALHFEIYQLPKAQLRNFLEPMMAFMCDASVKRLPKTEEDEAENSGTTIWLRTRVTEGLVMVLLNMFV